MSKDLKILIDLPPDSPTVTVYARNGSLLFRYTTPDCNAQSGDKVSHCKVGLTVLGKIDLTPKPIIKSDKFKMTVKSKMKRYYKKQIARIKKQSKQ